MMEDDKNMQDYAETEEGTWVFGYGSLIYKVDFPFLESRPAVIHDWSRRLWQGSANYRGTPENPGRVATLVRDEGATRTGMAYRVAPEAFEWLDQREHNYEKVSVTLHLEDGATAEGVTYIANMGNKTWLGEMDEKGIAEYVRHSSGKGGTNSEYVLRLQDALQELGVYDSHIASVANYLQTSSESLKHL